LVAVLIGGVKVQLGRRVTGKSLGGGVEQQYGKKLHGQGIPEHPANGVPQGTGCGGGFGKGEEAVLRADEVVLFEGEED
jgi:hypothetical protein